MISAGPGAPVSLVGDTGRAMGKVTLQSIADRVGVSRMTVSNAFSRPDQLSADLRERIRALRRALLVMHSPTDNTVGIANASEIFRAARHPRSFVSLEGADHLLTGKYQAARAARIISAWADPYL